MVPRESCLSNLTSPKQGACFPPVTRNLRTIVRGLQLVKRHQSTGSSWPLTTRTILSVAPPSPRPSSRKGEKRQTLWEELGGKCHSITLFCGSTHNLDDRTCSKRLRSQEHGDVSWRARLTDDSQLRTAKESLTPIKRPGGYCVTG